MNLSDYLVLADALILTGTTIGVMALCLGTVSILFDNTSTFTSNPLLDIKDAFLNVSNAAELKEAMLSVNNKNSRVENLRQYWPGAIEKVFYSLDENPNDRFCDFLDKLIKKECCQI